MRKLKMRVGKIDFSRKPLSISQTMILTDFLLLLKSQNSESWVQKFHVEELRTFEGISEFLSV